MSANKSGLINAQEEIGYWEKLENRYRDLYSSQVQENNSRAAQQTEKTLRQIGEQIDALNLQFKESNQALYRGFRAAQRKLPQQLAAAGITGGLSESSQVKLQSDYLSEMGKSNQEHTKAEQALRTKGLEAQGIIMPRLSGRIKAQKRIIPKGKLPWKRKSATQGKKRRRIWPTREISPFTHLWDIVRKKSTP